MPYPETIEDWKDLFSTRGPSCAAEAFLLKLGQVDAGTQRAALTSLPSTTSLSRRFSDVWENKTSPLRGVPFLAKDLYASAGDTTGAGSTFLAELLGVAESDASLISRTREAGGVLCGKTQLNEFALGMSGENPHFGDCPHPSRPELLSGGSSSGSAWAVGTGLVPFALGTDTSGSIRVPASFCGVYGLRLEPGLLSAEELFPLSPSFDTPGWFTRTAQDMLTVTQTLLGDWINSTPPPTRCLWAPCESMVSQETYTATSHQAREMGFVTDDDASRRLLGVISGVEKSYPVLGASEAAQIHQDWLEKYKALYDPVVWARLDAGRRRSAEEIAAANKHRQSIHACFQELFSEWDVIAMPTTPTGAQPKSGQTEALRSALLHLNAPASMASLPALTIPVSLPDGLTTGIQLIFPSLGKLNLRILSGI